MNKLSRRVQARVYGETTADIDTTLVQSLPVLGFSLTLKAEQREAICKFVSGKYVFVLGSNAIRCVCSLFIYMNNVKTDV